MCFKKWDPQKPFKANPIPWVLVVLGVLLATSVSTADDQKTYVANPIEGWVVEAGSKMPLEGVIAVVNWELVDAAHLPVGQLMVMETVTDRNGHFVFPAWGPKSQPPQGTLDPKAPQLLLFKAEYGYLRLINQLASDWNGKTVEMRRLLDDAIVNLGPGRVVSKRSLSLNGLSLTLGWAYRGKDCEWQQAPRMLAALHQTRKELERQGLRTDLRSIDDLPRSQKCGSPRDFFRSYLP
jgi:hypothetical protein